MSGSTSAQLYQDLILVFRMMSPKSSEENNALQGTNNIQLPDSMASPELATVHPSQFSTVVTMQHGVACNFGIFCLSAASVFKFPSPRSHGIADLTCSLKIFPD
jgi:hypothetical protein